MHGCYDAVMIYGFKEGNSTKHIDYDYLEEHGIEMYAVNVVRDYMDEAAYGIQCEFCEYTCRIISPSEEERKKVEELYAKFMEYHDGNRDSKLGYYLVVSGDYEWTNAYSIERTDGSTDREQVSLVGNHEEQSSQAVEPRELCSQVAFPPNENSNNKGNQGYSGGLTPAEEDYYYEILNRPLRIPKIKIPECNMYDTEDDE